MVLGAAVSAVAGIGKFIGVGRGGLKALFKKGGIKSLVKNKGFVPSSKTGITPDTTTDQKGIKRLDAGNTPTNPNNDLPEVLDDFLGRSTESLRTFSMDSKQLGTILGALGAVVLVVVLATRK